VWKVRQLTMYQPWKSQICVNYGSPRYVKLGSVRMLYHTVNFGCWGFIAEVVLWVELALV
jgi:hypothetical protein